MKQSKNLKIKEISIKSFKMSIPDPIVGIFITLYVNNPEYNNIIEKILIYKLLLIWIEGRAIATIKRRMLIKIITLSQYKKFTKVN